MLENLAQLDAHLHSEEIPTGSDVFVSPREWMHLAQWVPVSFLVYATADEPTMFWYLGRRIRQQINRE